nr:MAG TPA: hypothetical protein [Caudoviricetes sp.]
MLCCTASRGPTEPPALRTTRPHSQRGSGASVHFRWLKGAV